MTFRLDLPTPWLLRRTHNAFHASLRRRLNFSEAHETPDPTLIETPDGEKYEVESIIRHRKHRGKLQYLFKWKGYPDYDSTWESEADLKNSLDILQNYRRRPRRVLLRGVGGM